MSQYKVKRTDKSKRYLDDRLYVSDQLGDGKSVVYQDQNGDVHPVASRNILTGSHYKGQGPRSQAAADPYWLTDNIDKEIQNRFKNDQDPQLPIHKKTALKKIRYKYKGK